MSPNSVLVLLAQIADFWSCHASADELAERLGIVEHAPLSPSLRVVRPANPAWARVQVSVNKDGSAAWVSVDPAAGLPLTVGELRDALGDPSDVLRVHWNIPEQVKFHYRHKDFSCWVYASLDDAIGSSERQIETILILPDRDQSPGGAQ